ncbi:MAG: DUF2231 domain-containing protein, partial [Candidatus Nanopelagicales bacterium]
RDIRHVRRLSVGAVYSVSVLETVAGLPVHPLIVHAAVVLVPLVALGAILMAVWPRFSRRFGVLVAIMGGAALVASALAKLSGEQMAERVGLPERHAELADRMPLVVLLLAGLVLALWLLDRGIPTTRSRPGWVIALAAVTVIVSVGAVYWTFLVGHSGAESVWMGR